MNIQDKTFNNNLKRERKNKGFTQESIAETIGVSRKRYAKWEEDTWPPRQYIIKICEVLQIDDLYLFLSKDLVEH